MGRLRLRGPASLPDPYLHLFAFTLWPLDDRDVAGFLGKLSPADTSQTQLAYLLASLPAVFAAVIDTWTYAYLPRSAAQSLRPPAGQFVIACPYRFARHPLYFATLLSLLSFALLLNRLGFVIVAVGTAALLYRMMVREEAELAVVQGEICRKCLQALPRLFPVVYPKIPQQKAILDWRDGFRGGAYQWLLAASLVVLAASLKESLFYATLICALAVARWTDHRAKAPA
jgi:protein-S-isoprenylcysteine O-methyltransferase Ste14